MDEREREQARSFDTVAEAYDRGRPEFPEQAARWMTGERPGRVLDLAAGTGALTRPLLAAGNVVLAADPSTSMLVHLRRRSAGAAFAVVAGAAERLPLRDGIVDAVTVGQAYHWFDTDRAVPELARVLRPGGLLAMGWNMRDESVPWVRALSQIVGSESVVPDPSGTLGLSGFFGPVEWRRFRLYQPLDRARLLDLIRSRSYVAVLGERERDELLGRVGELYDQRRGDALGLQMPYVTHCLRATRLGH